MSEPFRTRRFVEFADTDMAGIAHFSAFYRWMEAAEHELIRSIGLSVYQKLDDGTTLSFPRVHASCDFLSPAKCEDTLDIKVRVERLGQKSVTYGFQFSNVGLPVAEGKITSVCCRLVEGQPPVSVPIPKHLREAFAPFVAEE